MNDQNSSTPPLWKGTEFPENCFLLIWGITFLSSPLPKWYWSVSKLAIAFAVQSLYHRKVQGLTEVQDGAVCEAVRLAMLKFYWIIWTRMEWALCTDQFKMTLLCVGRKGIFRGQKTVGVWIRKKAQDFWVRWQIVPKLWSMKENRIKNSSFYSYRR